MQVCSRIEYLVISVLRLESGCCLQKTRACEWSMSGRMSYHSSLRPVSVTTAWWHPTLRCAHTSWFFHTRSLLHSCSPDFTLLHSRLINSSHNHALVTLNYYSLFPCVFPQILALYQTLFITFSLHNVEKSHSWFPGLLNLWLVLTS